MRSSRAITKQRTPSRSTVSRRGQASAKATPLISVRSSIRNGGVPILKPTPGRAKSCSVIAASGAPKSDSARNTRRAFSGVASIHKSKSFVARGCPKSPTACPPTSMNRASASFNAVSRSRKSGLHRRTIRPSVLREAELPRERETVERIHRGPIAQRVALELVERSRTSEQPAGPGGTGTLPVRGVRHRFMIAPSLGRRSRGEDAEARSVQSRSTAQCQQRQSSSARPVPRMAWTPTLVIACTSILAAGAGPLPKRPPGTPPPVNRASGTARAPSSRPTRGRRRRPRARPR